MFIDSHCHLDFSCFSEHIDPLILKLEQNKITKVILPGTQSSGWSRIQKLCAQHTSLYYALGIHPHFLGDFQQQDLVSLKNKLFTPGTKCIALGEIGLDKYAKASDALQETVFIAQLKIAQQFELPIILHCVKKQNRVLALLKAHNFKQGGVYHAFSGSLEIAEEFIKLGFKLGIGGVITYPNSTKTRETVSKIPATSMVLETDAPDMPIYQQQAEYNNPLNLLTIFDCLANIRCESKVQLSRQLYTNTVTIFPLCND